MRISDWSSDVCSSDLLVADAYTRRPAPAVGRRENQPVAAYVEVEPIAVVEQLHAEALQFRREAGVEPQRIVAELEGGMATGDAIDRDRHRRSEESRVGEACVSTGRARW